MSGMTRGLRFFSACCGFCGDTDNTVQCAADTPPCPCIILSLASCFGREASAFCIYSSGEKRNRRRHPNPQPKPKPTPTCLSILCNFHLTSARRRLLLADAQIPSSRRRSIDSGTTACCRPGRPPGSARRPACPSSPPSACRRGKEDLGNTKPVGDESKLTHRVVGTFYHKRRLVRMWRSRDFIRAWKLEGVGLLAAGVPGWLWGGEDGWWGWVVAEIADIMV